MLFTAQPISCDIKARKQQLLSDRAAKDPEKVGITAHVRRGLYRRPVRADVDRQKAGGTK